MPGNFSWPASRHLQQGDLSPWHFPRGGNLSFAGFSLYAAWFDSIKHQEQSHITKTKYAFPQPNFD